MEAPKSSGAVEVMATVYAVLLGDTVMFSFLSSTMANAVESPLGAMPYVAFKFDRNWFWAVMLATTPGTPAAFTTRLSSTINQSPRF